MRGGCKVMGPLSLVVFLLVCNAKQIYGEALNGMVGVYYNTWPIEHPAGSGVYESDSNSLPSDNGIQSTKSFGGMMGRRILAEEKSNSAEGRRSEHSRWIARTIHHLRRAAGHIALDLKHFASKSQEIVAAANHDQLSGASFNHKNEKYYEWKSLAAKQTNSVSRHSMNSHDGDDDDDGISYDQGPNFHVDYSGPKTHSAKHH